MSTSVLNMKMFNIESNDTYEKLNYIIVEVESVVKT